jgi:hypothetical protein
MSGPSGTDDIEGVVVDDDDDFDDEDTEDPLLAAYGNTKSLSTKDNDDDDKKHNLKAKSYADVAEIANERRNVSSNICNILETLIFVGRNCFLSVRNLIDTAVHVSRSCCLLFASRNGALLKVKFRYRVSKFLQVLLHASCYNGILIRSNHWPPND